MQASGKMGLQARGRGLATRCAARACVAMVCAVLTGAVHAQFSVAHVDGQWNGQLSCSAALFSARTPGSFIFPLNVHVRDGVGTGVVDTHNTVENFRLAVDATGTVVVTSEGYWKNDIQRRWRTQARGSMQDLFSEATGTLEDLQGRKIRDCRYTFVNHDAWLLRQREEEAAAQAEVKKAEEARREEERRQEQEAREARERAEAETRATAEREAAARAAAEDRAAAQAREQAMRERAAARARAERATRPAAARPAEPDAPSARSQAGERATPVAVPPVPAAAPAPTDMPKPAGNASSLPASAPAPAAPAPTPTPTPPPAPPAPAPKATSPPVKARSAIDL